MTIERRLLRHLAVKDEFGVMGMTKAGCKRRASERRVKGQAGVLGGEAARVSCDKKSLSDASSSATGIRESSARTHQHFSSLIPPCSPFSLSNCTSVKPTEEGLLALEVSVGMHYPINSDGTGD